MGLFDWLGLGGRFYTATKVDADFVEAVETHIENGNQELKVHFSESIGDGNQIDRMTILANSELVDQIGLAAGEELYRLTFDGTNPNDYTFKFVFADADDQVLYTDIIEFQREN